jgi:hypothetical protein
MDTNKEQIETILDNEFACLPYHPQKKIVHHSYHQATSGTEFRELLNTGIETMRTRQATKWLSDNRNSMVLSPEDSHWAMSNWFPRAVQAGWKYWAIVVPENAMTKFNMMEFIDSYVDSGLKVVLFTTPEAALEWFDRFD